MSETRARLGDLFRRELARLKGWPGVVPRLAIDTTVPRSRRAMAYTTGRRVVFYERALELPTKNLVALIRHELAHVLLWHRRHTEREADELAEEVFGQAIHYDACGVQTIGRGTRPRPRKFT